MDKETELANLPSYKLQKRIPQQPDFLFFFGAGASHGSDVDHLAKQGKLPPLGRDLFQALYENKNLKYWNKLPPNIVTLFKDNSFEDAMDLLDDNKEFAKESLRRDLDLSWYFSAFRPMDSNLYWRSATAISKKLKSLKWKGAAITLNHERLLEESLMRNYVFTVVKGVTFYDDNLPTLNDDQLFEVCYPHGACQFFIGQNWFNIKDDGNIVFGKDAKLLQEAGVNHILKWENIKIACDGNQIPLICRYHPSKRPVIENYFNNTQRERSSELILNAKHITIIGVYCSHSADKHIWEPLEITDAFITYVNSNKVSQDLFKKWASKSGKIEKTNYMVIPKTFKDAFQEILQINELN
jgi:hypothetical protein